jgi:hypothetical protein
MQTDVTVVGFMKHHDYALNIWAKGNLLIHGMRFISNSPVLSIRTLLALLGVVIGTASIVTLINISHNATYETIRLFSRMGTNIVAAQFSSAAGARIYPEAFDKEQPLKEVSDLRSTIPDYDHADLSILW